MAKIEGQILIGWPVEEVFDFVADSRNEPQYNPAMTSVELLTALPIGRGTRFRARIGRAGTLMLVELTEFDRPHRLGSRTTSSMMDTSGALSFAADGDGTVMSWDWQVRPKGWMRMLGPLFGSLGGRMERRIWAGMKRYLENTAARPVTRPTPWPGHGGRCRRTGAGGHDVPQYLLVRPGEGGHGDLPERGHNVRANGAGRLDQRDRVGDIQPGHQHHPGQRVIHPLQLQRQCGVPGKLEGHRVR